MIVPKKHIAYSNQEKFNYLLFDSLGQFNEFVDQETKKLSSHHVEVLKTIHAGTQAKIESGSNWYGLPVPASITELDEHNSFLGMGLLEQLRPKIEKHLSDYLCYLDAAVLPKPRIGYNDRGVGLFSFDRAAMGLYRTGNIALGTPIEKTIAQLHIELGRDTINTRVKKVYAWFEHKDRSHPSIRLYLMAGGNANVEGKALLYVGLACAELVEFLEIRGVAVEVSVLIGSAYQNQVCLASVRVKRFQDKTDKNRLLLLSSDPRYFRYRGFKALIALSNHFGLNIPKGLGRLEESMGYRFVKAHGPRGASSQFVFEQSYSLESAAKEVKRIIETYKTRLDNEKKG